MKAKLTEEIIEDMKGSIQELKDFMRYGSEPQEMLEALKAGNIDELVRLANVVRHLGTDILLRLFPQEMSGEDKAKEDGPQVILTSRYAWGRGKTYYAALWNLLRAGGEEEEIENIYVTDDPGACVRGIGVFFSEGKHSFKIPIARNEEGEGVPVKYFAEN